MEATTCSKCDADAKWIDCPCGDEMCFATRCYWDKCAYVEWGCVEEESANQKVKSTPIYLSAGDTPKVR
jgi:hypothetical protein